MNTLPTPRWLALEAYRIAQNCGFVSPAESRVEIAIDTTEWDIRATFNGHDALRLPLLWCALELRDARERLTDLLFATYLPHGY